MTDNSPDSTSTQKLFEWLGTIGLNIVCLLVGIAIGFFVLPKTRFFVNHPISIPASSTSTSQEKRAHMGFLDQIQGCGSVKRRILWSYVEDQARYLRNEPQQCRLIALEELLHPEHIEACKSQYKKKIIQPFVNLFLANRLIQKFLYDAVLMVHDLSFNLENCTIIEKPLIKTFYFFNRLSCIGESISVLKDKLNKENVKYFSDQQQEQFIYDSLKEDFINSYKKNLVPFEEEKEQIEKYLESYFYVR